MKLSKEELKAKVNELVKDNEVAIALLEDIEDSMEVADVDTSLIDELQAKLNDLQEKYKERFLKGEEVEEKIEEEKKEDDDSEELKEEEVIDVKEI